MVSELQWRRSCTVVVRIIIILLFFIHFDEIHRFLSILLPLELIREMLNEETVW